MRFIFENKATINLKRVFGIIFILVLSISLTTLAHPERTDSSGGHRDSSTGEYHYHHGYPEHQHPNGTCPYEFDDNTSDSDNDSNHYTLSKDPVSSTSGSPFIGDSYSHSYTSSAIVTNDEFDLFESFSHLDAEIQAVIIVAILYLLYVIWNHFKR